MLKLSYAQNREDVLLDRVFSGRTDGYYIDVGACHPVCHSVTKYFYERGWRGINIEPIPRIFEILAADRPRDVNLPVGISDREGTLYFYECPASVGMSTFSPRQADELRRAGHGLVEHRIPVTTLGRVCEEHAPAGIDFLKIDAESHEREVLDGADWSRFRPRVVLIEATLPEDWEPSLLARGYLFAAFDGLNRYYVREEDRGLLPMLEAPANVLDGFEPHEYLSRIRGLEQELGYLRRSIEGAPDRGGDNLDVMRHALHQARLTLEEMRRELDDARAELGDARDRLRIFEGWGPMTIGAAARLRRVASRFPRARSLVRRAVLLRRGLLDGAGRPSTYRDAS